MGCRVSRQTCAVWESNGQGRIFDEVEHGDAGGRRRREALSVQQLALEGGEEALAQRVVVGSPTEPIEGRMPAARHRQPKATDVYWHPWSE